MNKKILFVVFIEITCVVLVNCQISNVILRPAYNFLNYLTGGSPQQSNNVQYQSQPIYSSSNQPEVQYVEQPSYSSSGSCGRYWSIQRDQNGYSGLVSISNPDLSKNIIRVVSSLGAKLSGQYYGSIDLLKDRKSSADDVLNGQPLLLKIIFPLQNPLPNPTEIYHNNRLICTEPKVTASYVTTITLDYTFTISGNSNGNVYNARPQAVYTTVATQTQPYVPYYSPEIITTTFTPQTTRKAVTTTSPQYYPQPVVISQGFECGISDYKAPLATGLIINGQTAARGQFPWLAAYYHNGKGDSGFICGGSLVSTRVIITAAHCIHSKMDPLIRKAEEATFYIGKHNLESLIGEDNYVISGVNQFVVHPDWDTNSNTYDADIAIAVLARTVPFSKFAKPICLWTTSNSAADLVGQKGVVAGWGKTEFSAISKSTPKFTSIKVVDLLTCIRSNDAFNQLTSDRTFCAGDNVEGSGPCSGDSGGGFVVKSGDKWYLRGVVSSALNDPARSTCDTKSFAVFTDVTKFTSWIQQYVQSFG